MAVTGILGGRFDPPHVGHLALADAAMKHFAIEELYVTVIVDAAHKPSIAPIEHRLEMARLTFAPLGAVVEREEHRYTVDALEVRSYDDPIFLIGADELADLPTWKQPERLLELTRLGVATRPGYVPESSTDRIEVFELEPQPVSSTEIRERVRHDESVAGLVVPEVAAYIAEQGLYRDP